MTTRPAADTQRPHEEGRGDHDRARHQLGLAAEPCAAGSYRQPGRQGPAHDPNRDGCGPAALAVLTLLLLVVAVIVQALT